MCLAITVIVALYSCCLACGEETVPKYKKVLRNGEIAMFLKDFYIQRTQKLLQALSDNDTTTTIDLDAVPLIKSKAFGRIHSHFFQTWWKTYKHIIPFKNIHNLSLLFFEREISIASCRALEYIHFF